MRLCVYKSLLDICGQAVKSLFDIDVAFRGHLEEGDAEFVCEGLALFGGYLAFIFPVAFVADEDFVDTFTGVLFDV